VLVRSAWLASVLVGGVLALPGAARAQTLELPGAGGAAWVGRAGAGAVAADDAAALALNPAGLARRGGLRAQLGLAWQAWDARFVTAEDFGTGATAGDAQGEPTLAPSIGVQLGLGDRWVVGASYLEPVGASIGWPSPDPTRFDAMRDDKARYPWRYAGAATRLERRGVGAGMSLRALSWLAVGASAWLWRVDAAQDRAVWGGLGVASSLPNLTPAFDMTLSLRGSAWTPGAAVGVLAAPEDAPLELALSVAWTGDATLGGAPSLTDSRGADTQTMRFDTAQVASTAHATLDLPGGLTLRAGARFLAPRVAVELDGELGTGAAVDPVWRVFGVGLTSSAGPSGTITTAPMGTSLGDARALRAAVDVDVVPGFLTLTAGWAWTRGAVRRGALTPALPSLEAHTLAFGAQTQAGGATVTIGVAHAFGMADSGVGRATVLAPLATGSAPAAAGAYDASTTTVAVGVEWQR
jgi:long-subunit fatty acid transport protein